MTDKKLLKLAAKAAGIFNQLVWVDKVDVGLMDESWMELKPERHHFSFKGSYPEQEWNPLADDGDALRLAVKLGFIVEISQQDRWTYISYSCCDSKPSVSEKHHADSCAATRRAIVRAAAEIGRNMK